MESTSKQTNSPTDQDSRANRSIIECLLRRERQYRELKAFRLADECKKKAEALKAGRPLIELKNDEQ